MDVKYCDICGNKIKKPNETWTSKLVANNGNPRVSFDSEIKEVCESCATILHCCTALMKQGLAPDFSNPNKICEEVK